MKIKAAGRFGSGKRMAAVEQHFFLLYKRLSFPVLVMGISKSTRYIFLYFIIWIHREGEKGKEGEREKKDIR